MNNERTESPVTTFYFRDGKVTDAPPESEEIERLKAELAAANAGWQEAVNDVINTLSISRACSEGQLWYAMQQAREQLGTLIADAPQPPGELLVAVLCKRIAELETQLDKVATDYDNRGAEIVGLQQQLAKEKHERARMSDLLFDRREERNRARIRVKELETQLASTQPEIERLAREIASLWRTLANDSATQHSPPGPGRAVQEMRRVYHGDSPPDKHRARAARKDRISDGQVAR